MKKILLSILVMFCIQGSIGVNAQALGKNVHTVLFLGNSITYAGGYIVDIESYIMSRYPGANIEFIDEGLPSETVSGLSEPGHAGGKFPRPDLHERLHRVLDKIKPDLIFASYGMNDGTGMPFEAGRFQKYKDGINWLRDTLISTTSARVIFLTPTIYDELRGANKGYANVLDKYSEWLLSQKKSLKWEVIDLHFPMKKYLEAHRKVDAKFAMDGFGLAPDGVHPGEAGHWLMAKQILLYFGENVAKFPTAKAAMAGVPNGDQILKLVGDRQSIMKDAWLTYTGHKRPMKEGLPMDEARAKASVIGLQLDSLVIK